MYLKKLKFVNKSNKIFNNKYDYSMVEYLNSKSKVKIICPVHGIFHKTPNKHISGQGCSKCSKKYRMNINDFIIKSNNIHNKYDYSISNFLNLQQKIKIKCPIHGIFEQTPTNHINLKQGCPKCSKKSPTNEEFINKCNIIHNNFYDYHLVKYINAQTKIKIICPVHGIFEQYPYAHLNKKQGCPICSNKSKGENNIKFLLDKYKIYYLQQYKFNKCKNIYKLRFDFYLPEQNICIEYDGIQHFKSINYFGGEKRLIKQQKHDDIKNNFCKINNIKLIRIKYNEKISEKLNFLIK